MRVVDALSAPRTAVLAAILVSAMPGLAPAQQPRPHLTLYKTASSAACSDQTVWVDPKTQTYYLRGERLYGKTRPGGYNCRQQAEAAGYRAATAR
jgi:hypothetical protein